MDAETTRELEKLSKSLGRLLGATALWREARKKGINVSKSDVKAFVEKISSKQVLAPGPASLGKSATTTASGEGSRWQSDLIQYRFSADDEEEDDDDETKKRYAVVVISVFDRTMHGVAVPNKESQTVLNAFRKLVNKLPGMKGGVLSTDGGLEYTNREFKKSLDAWDIAHKVKGNGEVNSLAVLDAAIAQVRRDVKARLLENPEKSWSQVLGAAITAHNRRYNSTMRDSPNDVLKPGNEELQFLQISDNSKRFEHNDNLAERRVAKAKDMGAYRAPLKPKAFKRGFEAAWGPKIELQEVKSGTLLKGRGEDKLLDVKAAQVVHRGSDSVADRAVAPRARAGAKREKAAPVIDALDGWIKKGQTKPLRNAGPFLRETMIEGEYDKILSVAGNLAGLLALFPKKYELFPGQGRDNYYMKRLL